MGRTLIMQLQDVEDWPDWFRPDGHQVRLFHSDPDAISQLKTIVDPMFWADILVADRLSGLVQSQGQTVLVQVHESVSLPGIPSDMARVVIWPIPFEKGRRRREKEDLWNDVLSKFEVHGYSGRPRPWFARLSDLFSFMRNRS